MIQPADAICFFFLVCNVWDRLALHTTDHWVRCSPHAAKGRLAESFVPVDGPNSPAPPHVRGPENARRRCYTYVKAHERRALLGCHPDGV
jgi:hypothetical protein